MGEVLGLKALAERWSVPPEALRRRIAKLGLPAVNVGTPKEPDWRFRRVAIEKWEAANETHLTTGREEPAVSVPPGMPAGLEGYDPYRAAKPRRKARRAGG